jgi:hypothetical protein
MTVPIVTVPVVDYAANHAAALAKGEDELTALQAARLTAPEKDYPDLDDAIARTQAAIVTFGKAAPLVSRFTDIALEHAVEGDARGDLKHKFTASFDGATRLIPCPLCGAEVEIPAQYRELL